MREVLGVGVGCVGVNNRKLDRSESEGTDVDMKTSSIPGYLELAHEKIERLICQKPIEEFYEVEDQPFARGKYAAVRRCTHRSSGQQFAAKFLRKRRRSADLRPEILHEVAVLEACATSSRIVRLHQVFESAHEMILLLELASGGELQMLLDKDEVPEERQVKRLMRQILDGLVFLHSINVAHLDIKPQNLVLMSDFPHGEVKLCDLGISRYISQGADIRDILGTPDYVAPEVLNYEPISLATDMWSVGVLLYVLLTGCSPFGGDTKQETFCNISQCKLDFPDDLFEDVSEDAKDLMRKLMVKEPSKRLTASESLHHHWFTDLDCPMQRPLPIPIRNSETIVTKKEETKTKQFSPVTPRKQENITSQSKITATKTVTVSKSSPSITMTPTIQRPKDTVRPITKTASESALVKVTPVVPSEKTERFGMSSSRRSRFMRNMEHLAQSYMDLSNLKNNNVIDSKSTGEKVESVPSSTVEKTEVPTVVMSSKVENKSSSNVEHNSSSKVENKSLSSVENKSSKVENNSSSNVENKSSSNVENKSSSNVDNKSSSNVENKSSSNVENKSSSNVENKSSSNVENKSSSNVENKSSSNVDNKSSSNVENKSSSNVNNDKSSSGIDNNKSPSKVNNNNTTFVTRTVNKATAMQTMPVNGIDGYKFNHSVNTESSARRLQQNLNLTAKIDTEVPRRVLDNKDCVYTFRKCFIIDDSEEDANHGTAPVIIHGTTMTSENGHSYSDHSSSDSGSDSVSEMSIDSSSDRSSIISLDDSLLEYNYSKINGRPYPGINYVSYSATNHNVWDSSAMLNVPKTDRTSRYSSNDSFSKAFARFNSVPGDKQEEAVKKPLEKSIFTTTTAPSKPFAKAAHTSILNKVLTASISSSDATATTRKVDFLREHNSNIVIIRELKTGKYSRISEMKCESLQSRIKKLQVQGGKS